MSDNEYGLEVVDLVEENATLEGLSGHFLMSRKDGSEFVVPFYYDGETRTISYTTLGPGELLQFRDFFRSEAQEAWLAHRDNIRDSDVAVGTIPSWGWFGVIPTSADREWN